MSADFENNGGDYILHATYTRRERVVGFFVFAGFALFLFFVVISIKNQYLFDQRFTYYIKVKTSEGISKGTVVKALGTEVGRVSRLSLTKEGDIRVVIEVYARRQALVRADARALVNRLSGIGNTLIEIKSDSISAPILAAGSTIPVDETVSLNDLILSVANLIQAADSKKLLGRAETILPKLEQTLTNIHTIIEQIATGHGTLGAAVFDQEVEQELKVVVKLGAEILGNVHLVASDVRSASQSLPDLAQQLHTAIAQANTALIRINNELDELPRISLDVRSALLKLDNVLDSAQHTWPLSRHAKPPKQQQLIPAHSDYE